MDSGFRVCGFRIPHPWILDSLSGWIPDFKILFWILDYISRIPDSKAVNSGFHSPNLPGFQIPDYLTWGDGSRFDRKKVTSSTCFLHNFLVSFSH